MVLKQHQEIKNIKENGIIPLSKKEVKYIEEYKGTKKKLQWKRVYDTGVNKKLFKKYDTHQDVKKAFFASVIYVEKNEIK